MKWREIGTHVIDRRIGTKLGQAMENHIELAYAVIAQGHPVYQRDEVTRVEFEARVMGLYGDYLPVLHAQRADVFRGEEHAARVRRYRGAIGRTERTISQIRAPQNKAAHANLPL